MMNMEAAQIQARLQKVKEAVDRYMAFIDSEDFHEDSLEDYKHDIFEKAVELYRGPGIWDYINKKPEGVKLNQKE